MSEELTGKVRRRVRLCPSDTIQNPVTQFAQHLRDRKDVVVGPTYPNRSLVRQFLAAKGKPESVELVVLFKSA